MKVFVIAIVAVSLLPPPAFCLNPSNYLQSLSPPNHNHQGGWQGGTPRAAPSQSSSTWIPLETYGRPYKPPKQVDDDSTTLHHASLEYFRLEELTEDAGPRANADVGEPHQAARELVHLSNTRLSAGSWWCSTGGWPSTDHRTSTEVFFVLAGRGSLTDMDGITHEFGPGDTVTLPKGWCGRWDIREDMQKVWFVHEHAKVEEVEYPIRARVTPYETMMAPQYLNPLAGGPGAASRLLYAAGPTTVGSVMCAPGSSSKACPDAECFHLIEGILFLTTPDGISQRCVAGDTVVLPRGWSGHHDVVEKTTMLWISVENESA